jgi:peptidoglycan/LPS O-acetylase OafA/YrhL
MENFHKMNEYTRPRDSHFKQLDALRGIAALTVVFNHLTIIEPLRWLWKTPLRFFLTGHDAVILFFLVSGFVLALQLTSRRSPTFGRYLVKRICRIYLPYVAVLLVTYAIIGAVFHGAVPWAGVWVNSAWDGSFSAADFLSHIMFIGEYRANHVIPVIWTLIYEMRISLFFPLIVYAVARVRARYSIAAATIASASAYVLLFLQETEPVNANLRADWTLTVHYAGIFTVGAVLAIHRMRWQTWLLEGSRKGVIFAASLAFYFLSRGVLGILPSGFGDFLFDWGVAVGASGIICTSIASERITSLLALRPIVFLGALSYSLYLTHTVVLLSVIHLMPSAETSWMALALAAVLLVPVATATYYLIERPSMILGKILTERSRALPLERLRSAGEERD